MDSRTGCIESIIHHINLSFDSSQAKPHSNTYTCERTNERNTQKRTWQIECDAVFLCNVKYLWDVWPIFYLAHCNVHTEKMWLGKRKIKYVWNASVCVLSFFSARRVSCAGIQTRRLIRSHSVTSTHDFIHNFEHHCHRLYWAWACACAPHSPACLLIHNHQVLWLVRTCILPFIWRIERQPNRNFKNLDYHLLFIGCCEFYFVRSLCARFSFRVLLLLLCSLSLAHSLVCSRSFVVYRKFCLCCALLDTERHRNTHTLSANVQLSRRWAWFHWQCSDTTQSA